jgi:peptidoglycan/xylan/chitin deacetylase (PgdA/CDA1 family)
LALWRVPRWPDQASPANAGAPIILMYHAVMNVSTDPWGLRVRPRNFIEHMAVLRAHAFPMSLVDLHAALDAGKVPPRAVTVTFDDGYANNLHHALPAMQRYRVPGTVFVASGYIGAPQEYWWDELDRLVLHSPRLPDPLRLTIDGTQHEFRLDGAASFTKVNRWRTRHWFAWQAPPTPRHRVFLNIWKRLHDASSVDAREQALQQLRLQAGASVEGRPTHRCCTVDELHQLAGRNGTSEDSGGNGGTDGIEIGAHTVMHPSLGHLSVPEQRREIFESKATLENLLQKSVTSFCYPYGKPEHQDYTSDTISLLREAGFARACANVQLPLTATTDRYQLPRRVVMDWTGAELVERLAAWFGER